MRILGSPAQDADGDGFDRRDFAPTGTRFPATTGGPPGRAPSGPSGRGILRIGLIAAAAVAIALLAGLLLRARTGVDPADPTYADAAPASHPVSQRPGAAPTGPAPADQAGTSAPERVPDAAAPGEAGATSPAEDPAAAVDRMIPAELQGAAAFAVQFANSYLNYDDTIPDVRAQALRAYLAPDLDPQLGWSGQGRQLAVMTLALDARPLADQRVSVTVAAQVTGVQAPRWVYLAVPVAQDDRGRWAVVATPAFVPRPDPGTPPAGVEPPTDVELSATLRAGVESLMTAYGAQRDVRIDGLTAPEADIRGLEGQYAFLGLADLRVAEGDDDRRTAMIDVVWDNPLTGGAVEQRYTLHLVRRSGAWLVTAVDPG